MDKLIINIYKKAAKTKYSNRKLINLDKIKTFER